MGLYISGCFVAFVLSIISLISALIDKHSQMSKNFEKIGFFYSLSSRKYKLKIVKRKEIRGIIGNILGSVIFSWISVVGGIYGRIKKWVDKSRLPDKMKEINFKLEHKNLDKEEMLALWDEGNEYLGYDEWSYYYKADEELAEFNNGILTGWYELSLGDGGWVESVQVSPNINRLFWLEASKCRAFEYRITGTKLLVRCMQYDVRNGTEFAIKNGKINETTLKAWYALGNQYESEEEYIKSFQQLCEWHLLLSIRVTAFVFAAEEDMKKGSNKMKKEKFNQLIDSKINDLQKCAQEIDDLKDKYKFLKEAKDTGKLNKAQQKEQKEYREEFNRIQEKYGCSYFDECRYKEKIIEEIDSYKL